MADISTEDLKSEIHAILKTADLNVVSAKKVREQLEQKLNCSLLNRKKEFTDIVMDFINQQQEAEEQNNSKNSGGDDSAESESEELNSDKETARRKKNATAANKSTNSNSAKKRQATTKKKKFTSNGSGSDSDSDNGSDSDYEQPKAKKTKKKAASGEGGNTTGRKSTGFTRAYTLSPELAELVGAESMPRHEVVKKVWALIKERQLYDPKNKQYAICDDDLLKVMKVKRFRAFSMLKHLKPHFID